MAISISLQFMATFIGMGYAHMPRKIFQPHAPNPNLGEADWLPFRMLLLPCFKLARRLCNLALNSMAADLPICKPQNCNG
jgi:hypothetical protein